MQLMTYLSSWQQTNDVKCVYFEFILLNIKCKSVMSLLSNVHGQVTPEIFAKVRRILAESNCYKNTKVAVSIATRSSNYNKVLTLHCTCW